MLSFSFSIYPPIFYPPIYQSIYRSVHLSIYLSISLSIHLSIYRSINLLIFLLSEYLFLFLSREFDLSLGETLHPGCPDLPEGVLPGVPALLLQPDHERGQGRHQPPARPAQRRELLSQVSKFYFFICGASLLPTFSLTLSTANVCLNT